MKITRVTKLFNLINLLLQSTKIDKKIIIMYIPCEILRAGELKTIVCGTRQAIGPFKIPDGDSAQHCS